MLKLSDFKLSKRVDDADLRSACAQVLGISECEVLKVSIQKLSVDARRKTDIRFVYTLIVSVENEQAVLKKLQGRKKTGGRTADHLSAAVSLYTPPETYVFPTPDNPCIINPPVIIGTGPAGLFAALCLAGAGIKCIILERGQPMDERITSVSKFWREGILDESSNVQFGEGGAGTFSDGKLTTGISDRRIAFVLEELVRFGAPDDILYLSKPHIGTDRLRDVVTAMRKHLIKLGCEVRFGHTLFDIELSDGALKRVFIKDSEGTYSLDADRLILAPGNSARDTFSMLYSRGVRISPKGFSVGVRIEHLQKNIDLAQYGHTAISSGARLPASDYKLAAHLKCGRSVYSFCVCPGGQVVAAASEHGGVVTNGMSLYARDGENICGALLVSITPEDFGEEPLGGIEFQRKLEKAAFLAGGSDYYAPAQLVSDFLEKRASKEQGVISPTYLPGVRYCNLWDILPEFVCEAIYHAFFEFPKKVAGFSDPCAVMTAVETRSSCPVRIDRENYETVGIRGIFPCGEGAGYAGGIMSAAVDGIKCAEALIGHTT